ncbi:MAG: hypothetical protein ACI3Z5_02095 [Paludibacteraceae bacterium]
MVKSSNYVRPRPHYNATLLLPDNEILTIHYSLLTNLPLLGDYWVIIGSLLGDSATHTLPVSTPRATDSRSTSLPHP